MNARIVYLRVIIFVPLLRDLLEIEKCFYQLIMFENHLFYNWLFGQRLLKYFIFIVAYNERLETITTRSKPREKVSDSFTSWIHVGPVAHNWSNACSILDRSNRENGSNGRIKLPRNIWILQQIRTTQSHYSGAMSSKQTTRAGQLYLCTWKYLVFTWMEGIYFQYFIHNTKKNYNSILLVFQTTNWF